jgi:hypothetical protein
MRSTKCGTRWVFGTKGATRFRPCDLCPSTPRFRDIFTEGACVGRRLSSHLPSSIVALPTEKPAPDIVPRAAGMSATPLAHEPAAHGPPLTPASCIDPWPTGTSDTSISGAVTVRWCGFSPPHPGLALITVPVLALSPMLQGFLSLQATLPFPGDAYVVFGLSAVTFFYGGWSFLTGFLDEVARRRLGMMTLIAISFSVALILFERRCVRSSNGELWMDTPCDAPYVTAV